MKLTVFYPVSPPNKQECGFMWLWNRRLWPKEDKVRAANALETVGLTGSSKCLRTPWVFHITVEL
jgi:hypothetical protein